MLKLYFRYSLSFFKYPILKAIKDKESQIRPKNGQPVTKRLKGEIYGSLTFSYVRRYRFCVTNAKIMSWLQMCEYTCCILYT